MWSYREAVTTEGFKCYKYILVYVDDILCIFKDPSTIIRSFADPPFLYRLKDVGPPTRYLGAKIGKYQVANAHETWYISAEDYLAKAITVIEESCGPLKPLLKAKLDSPALPDYHPELDTSDFLSNTDTRLYQSYIGILRWAIELGRIDIAHSGCTMAVSFMAAPCQGHMVAVLRIFVYLRKYISCKLVIDPRERNWSDRTWASANWKDFYPDTQEDIPTNAPKPRGQRLQINLFCDASHATNLVTRRSNTGIIFFLNGTAIRWYSKPQNTIESSTFGSEFVALKIAAEMNKAMRYKLRMLGIPIQEPTNTFCDNNSVVMNVTRPESTLQKKHNSIAYHKVRECVAAEAMRIHHEPGASNLADLLTKWLPPHKHLELCRHILWH